MTIFNADKRALTYYGLSSDTKPVVADMPTERLGSIFEEIDTGRRYLWGGAAWSRQYREQLAARPPTYFYDIPTQVHVAGASSLHWDLFNADANYVVRVLSILQRPNILTAVTGVVFDWLLERSTAVGTGGTALTAWLSDSSVAALSASITARSKATGGATQGTDLFTYQVSSEETDSNAIAVAMRGGFELVPPALRPGEGGLGIVLRNGEGVRCVQVTNSNAGNTAWTIGFTVERV